ncbi:hypothetical protein ACE4ZU_26290, partial [Salmonella enterica]|uniref:hypothetical protein n=1 Tax=Salmonella enterica TaxID=28901 RepID=UPI003D281CCC
GVLILRAQAVSNAVTPAPVTQGTAQPVPPACLRPFKRPDLATDVGNAARFDRLLARQLRATPATLVVDVATPWKVDTPPPAPLDHWMGQLSANG